MATGFEQAILSFLDHYGYWALFVLLTLETAMILHFVPSELIIAVTAATLVRSPLSLALLTLDATIAATLGSLILYAAARFGGREFLLRYPRVFHVTPTRLDKLHATFERPAGPTIVFVCRTLPVVRAAVSIPAGLARMDVPRFTAYSAAGHAIFSLAIAWVASTASAQALVASARAWAVTAWPFLLLVALATLMVAAWLWWKRRDILRRPGGLALDALFHAGLLVAGVGVALLLLAVLAPGLAASLVTSISDDYAAWAARHGLSAAALALVAALELLGIAVLALGLAQAVRRLRRGA